MKIKFYAPFLISLGLALASTNSNAKSAHQAVKKHTVVSAKRIRVASHKTNDQKTNFHKRHSVSTNSKLLLNRANSLSLIRSLDLEQKYPDISTHRYPISQTNDSDPLVPTNENRIHSIIIPDKTYSIAEKDRTIETPRHFRSSHGIIEFSFTHAAHKAGLSNSLIMELTRIFAWDIDFASSLRSGDQFTVIYKDEQSFGKKREPGQIISAEFMTQGKIFTAVRYIDSNGIVNYYTPEGKSMQKAFLSTPVDFARISSHFDSHRKHPVLNRIRAHKGVDYAARTGTPVKSAGDGIVGFRGRKGGYGQVMIIKHGDHYETLYAHLSDFKKGLKSGDTVRQGEVIGYVGQTGLATGPHLHYEFRIDGVHHNPESLSLEHSMPLDSHLLADFKSQTRPLLAQLYQAKASNLLAGNVN